MAKRRDIKLVDLCKINTDAFRHMTPKQLKRAERSIGTYMDFNQKEKERASIYHQPKKIERRGRTINALLHSFISDLHTAITYDTSVKPGQQEDFERRERESQQRYDDMSESHRAIVYGKEHKRKAPLTWVSNARIKEMYQQGAAEHERKIWEWQERAGCQIKPNELVARDAVKSNPPRMREAARIRKKAFISGPGKTRR